MRNRPDPADASEAEIRARYLELVKQFPPELEPEKFREALPPTNARRALQKD